MREKIFLFLFLLMFLTSCLDPRYYVWRDEKVQNYESLPWSGPNTKPVRQYTTYGAPMSSKGGDSHDYRWKVSFSDRVFSYGDSAFKEIDKFLTKNNLLNRWNLRNSGYGIVSNGYKFYEFKMVSIHPIIIIARPYGKKEAINSNKELRDWDIIGHGTSITFQENLFYFSPDLNILPQPMDLGKNQEKIIYWNELFNSGSVSFKEINGILYVKRLENKYGKNTKKDEAYDPNYHLQLISKEDAMKNMLKEEDKREAEEKERNRYIEWCKDDPDYCKRRGLEKYIKNK